MYQKTISLRDNEIPAKIDISTGEIRQIYQRKNNISPNKELWLPKASFEKYYTGVWQFLREQLTNTEFAVANTFIIMAKANTNSLEPLNDSTTLKELSEKLYVSINKVKIILDKLFKLGFYAKFEVVREDQPHTKFWILNPYVSFKGRIITSDIAKLFQGTTIEKEYHRRQKEGLY